ncbi:MAG TPA: hypothetical protein VJ486_12470 [Geothrix sp.]|nr:hypothetical protein [Geothrix sp.]
MRLWKRSLLLIPLVLVGLVASVHLLENWRGARAWEAWKASRQAAGDSYDMKVFNPEPIPDAENYAAHPAVAKAMKVVDPTIRNPISQTELPAQAPPSGSWAEGRREDLKAWEATLQTRDLSAFLETYREPLARIEEASHRPHCRLPVDYTKGEVPSLLGHRGFARTFRLRALVRLQQRRPAEAEEDILTVLRIANVLEEDPALITHLLRVAMIRLMAQPLWEGLEAHAWTEPQLAALQQALARVDALKSYRRGLEVERLYWVQEDAYHFPTLSNRFINNQGWGESYVFPGWGWRLLCGNVIPAGWLRQNLLAHDRTWVEVFLPAMPPGEHRMDARILDKHHADQLERERRKEPLTPYTFIAKQSAQHFLYQQCQRAARTQVLLDQAVIVCALERFRLAKGRYPEVLAELCPIYLTRIPEDPVGEGSYRYRRLPAGSFQLWSLGWDGKDDGGESVLEGDFVVMGGEGEETQGCARFEQNRKATLRESLDRGDWAWPARKD